MLYFLLHDAAAFRHIAATFGASWRQHTFEPVVALAADLQSTFASFADRFRLTADEHPMLTQLTADRPFDRRLWRHSAGEILLYASADCPAIQTTPDTLAALVTPDKLTTIRQAHAGSRDLDFDGIPYRPGQAGLNDTADVARLAAELAGIDSAGWNDADLVSSDEPTEELAFARECLAAVRELYKHAQEHGQIVVCEDI